jgi:hypothetical protein
MVKGRTILPGSFCHFVESTSGTTEPTLCSIEISVEFLEEACVHIELVIYLQGDISLAVDRVREIVEVAILLYQRVSLVSVEKARG